MRQKVVAVDPDGASLKSVANFNGSIKILGVHRRGQSVECIMGLLEDIIDILEFGDGDDGTENFFLHNLHLFVDASEDGGLNEITFFSVTFAAELDLCAFVFTRFDVFHDSCKLEFRDLRALNGVAFEWIADDVFLCAGSK